MVMESIGRLLIFAGLFVVLLGVLIVLGARIPGIGNLPGDIVVRRPGFTFYFPIVTSIIVSIVLTIVLNVVFRLLNR